VWSDRGPVIVRWERPRRPITVNVLTGTSLSLLSSAAGRVFAAWLPEQQTEALLRAEIESGRVPAGIATLDDARRLLADVRARGLSVISSGYFARGVEAAAGPVFNFKNEINMSIALVGVEGTLDLRLESPVLLALKEACAALSLRLGATAVPGAEPGALAS
jgi:DNA-binding IclR family transcriptional regulator